MLPPGARVESRTRFCRVKRLGVTLTFRPRLSGTIRKELVTARTAEALPRGGGPNERHRGITVRTRKYFSGHELRFSATASHESRRMKHVPTLIVGRKKATVQ